MAKWGVNGMDHRFTTLSTKWMRSKHQHVWIALQSVSSAEYKLMHIEKVQISFHTPLGFAMAKHARRNIGL